MPIRPFAEVLQSEKFMVTTELNPPKGTALAPLLAHAEQLRDVVDAFNLTDSHSSRMSMAPLAVARLLVERGLEPILQVTCRDRNRLALQSDLLAAAALGVRNLVCMTGDPPGAGDHPDAKPVFDLDVLGLLQAVAATGVRALTALIRESTLVTWRRCSLETRHAMPASTLPAQRSVGAPRLRHRGKSRARTILASLL